MGFLADINPADWGLEFVGELDTAGPWEYHVVGVWRGIQSRKLYVAEDSGCSCTYAWDVTEKEDLKEVAPQELFDKLLAHANSSEERDRGEMIGQAITIYQRAINGGTFSYD